MTKQYVIPIFVPHLGCPNDCVFCNQTKISGQKTNVTKEDVKASRREMLTTTREALLSWGGFLTKLSENGAVCVVGHDGVMDGCREQGMTVVEL